MTQSTSPSPVLLALCTSDPPSFADGASGTFYRDVSYYHLSDAGPDFNYKSMAVRESPREVHQRSKSLLLEALHPATAFVWTELQREPPRFGEATRFNLFCELIVQHAWASSRTGSHESTMCCPWPGMTSNSALASP